MIAKDRLIIRYRLVGYLAIIAGIFFVVWAANAVYQDLETSVYRLKIKLPQVNGYGIDGVGMLDPQAKVYVRGYLAGQVKSVVLEDNRPVALVEFDDPYHFHSGTRFVSKVSGGLLSSRGIWITPSDTGALMKDNQSVDGDFEPSFVETMHRLKEVLVMMSQVSNLLKNPGFKNNASLSGEFWMIFSGLNDLVVAVDHQFNRIDHMSNVSVNGLNTYTKQTIDLAGQTQMQLNEIYRLEGQWLPRLDSIIHQVQGIESKSNIALDSIENNPVYRSVLQDRELLLAVQKLLVSVNNAVLAMSKGDLVPGMDGKSILKIGNVHPFRPTAHRKLELEQQKQEDGKKISKPLPTSP